MYKAGIYPDMVFADPIEEIQVRQRIKKDDKGQFKFIPEILDERLILSGSAIEEVENVF